MKLLTLLLLALMTALTGCATLPTATDSISFIPSTQPINLLQTVELNYATHESVTYQQIKDEIETMFKREMAIENSDPIPANRREYRLKDIRIENENINVFLELYFQPPSKTWLKHDALTWLWGVSVSGLYSANGNKFAGNIYSTGYNISIIESTPLANGGVIYWGIEKLNNSGKVFTDNSITNESIWIDGPGIATLN